MAPEVKKKHVTPKNRLNWNDEFYISSSSGLALELFELKILTSLAF
jgi:hypothetical protein